LDPAPINRIGDASNPSLTYSLNPVRASSVHTNIVCFAVHADAAKSVASRGAAPIVKSAWALTPDEFDGGHTPALSRPKELAERLEAYRVSIVRHGLDTRSQGDVS
jgi:hypothetical protein